MKTKRIALGLVALFIVFCETGDASQRLSQMRDLSVLEGVWQDVKWGDLLTIELASGKAVAKAVIDSRTTEEFVVQHSQFAETGLSFQYKIISNDTTVIATIDRFETEYLTGTWRLDDNTNSGEFKYVKILDRIKEEPKATDNAAPRQPIAKIYRLRDDGIVITSPQMIRIKMHDRLYAVANGQRIYMKVTFPMMTIARCKLEKSSENFARSLAEGTPVYR